MELGSASARAEAGAETTSDAAEARAALRTKSRRVGMEESMRGAGFVQQEGEEGRVNSKRDSRRLIAHHEGSPRPCVAHQFRRRCKRQR